MKPYVSLFFSFFFINCASIAQDKNIAPMSTATVSDATEIPYHQIPDYPEKITAGTSIGRTIDGLGYRYYWATKDLREQDLLFTPGNEGRNTKETLDHLFDLSKMILNAPGKLPNMRGKEAKQKEYTWEEKRKQTLLNFKIASDIFKASTDEEVANFKIVFQRNDSSNEFPIWHLMNGPIADAIYHVGQVVSYRRSSGNPMNPFVSVFMGKTKEK